MPCPPVLLVFALSKLGTNLVPSLYQLGSPNLGSSYQLGSHPSLCQVGPTLDPSWTKLCLGLTFVGAAIFLFSHPSLVQSWVQVGTKFGAKLVQSLVRSKVWCKVGPNFACKSGEGGGGSFRSQIAKFVANFAPSWVQLGTQICTNFVPNFVPKYHQIFPSLDPSWDNLCANLGDPGQHRLANVRSEVCAKLGATLVPTWVNLDITHWSKFGPKFGPKFGRSWVGRVPSRRTRAKFGQKFVPGGKFRGCSSLAFPWSRTWVRTWYKVRTKL